MTPTRVKQKPSAHWSSRSGKGGTCNTTPAAAAAFFDCCARCLRWSGDETNSFKLGPRGDGGGIAGMGGRRRDLRAPVGSVFPATDLPPPPGVGNRHRLFPPTSPWSLVYVTIQRSITCTHSVWCSCRDGNFFFFSNPIFANPFSSYLFDVFVFLDFFNFPNKPTRVRFLDVS